MRKSVKQISVGQTEVRHITTLVSEPVTMGDHDKLFKQHEMLRQMVDQPDLMNCGPAKFEDLHMYWTGTEWVIEMKVTVDRVPNI